MISVPRYIIVGIAGLFSGYHILLGLVSLPGTASPVPALVAMGLYAVATVLSLWPKSPTLMPRWLAAFNLAVCVAVTLLVTSQLDPDRSIGNMTWHVAAVGTLMTITSTRRQQAFAWAGVFFLVAQSVLWTDLGNVPKLGVIGSVLWVAVSHMLARALAKAGRDARQFALAEREATDWQAAQEAHLFERQFRLRQTSTMALPMLRRIVERNGDLNEQERQECLYLEGGIRDEIRGRKLLNDAVRREVMEARRRGTVVTLLDEGGIDDLDETEMERVLNRLASAIRSTRTDKLIARTVPEGSATAVTVVGVSMSGDGSASMLAQDDQDDEVDLWLEIPRTAG
ncbi:hypothetical protein [Planctomonas psychrotolerans]|uniref:hypothetical protein n=1 Tax=Planctomonas psychrotolerans TaxID=2528712 RepID=UPI00123A945D|nr:hypothetical protein [Planctomonas psychrotolerans]